MKLFSFLFSFSFISFITLEGHAQLMGKVALGDKVKKYDLNKDGKIDRVEYYKGKKLLRVEEDRNSDEKFDYVEIHDDPKFYLMIEQDTNFDGKVDFKKSYSKFKKHQSKVLIAIDRDFNGHFETSFVEVVNDLQKNTDCLHLNVADEIESLIGGGMNIAQQIPGGFVASGVGFRIENECLQKWGNSFKEIVRESVHEGMQCLDNLPKRPETLSGAQRNIFGLNQLFKDDQVSLVCSDKKYDWSGTAAYASTGKGEQMKDRDVTHPFVVLNPNYPKETGSKKAEETKEIKATIFHELLHNLGYRHSESIEFSYSCETCCFDNGQSKEAKEIACKICTGNYANEFDPNYLTDFVAFGRENYQESFALATVLRFSKLQKNSLDAISLAAEASGGVFNPIGPEMAKIVEENHPNVLSTNEQERISRAKSYEGMEEFKLSKATNEILAKSFYELYFNHNGEKTIELLNQNKGIIKKEISDLEKKDGNYKWIAQELQRNLDKLIYELWINDFPSTKTSNPAYELRQFFDKK